MEERLVDSYTHFKREVLVRRHKTNALTVICCTAGALFLLERLKGGTTSTLTIGCVRTERSAQSSAAKAGRV